MSLRVETNVYNIKMFFLSTLWWFVLYEYMYLKIYFTPTKFKIECYIYMYYLPKHWTYNINLTMIFRYDCLAKKQMISLFNEAITLKSVDNCTMKLPLTDQNRGCQFYWWRKVEYPGKTTDLSQVTDKL
jgi:hypothetical protein